MKRNLEVAIEAALILCCACFARAQSQGTPAPNPNSCKTLSGEPCTPLTSAPSSPIEGAPRDPLQSSSNPLPPILQPPLPKRAQPASGFPFLNSGVMEDGLVEHATTGRADGSADSVTIENVIVNRGNGSGSAEDNRLPRTLRFDQTYEYDTYLDCKPFEVQVALRSAGRFSPLGPVGIRNPV